VVHFAVAHLVEGEVYPQFAAAPHPVRKFFLRGGQQQLVAPHAGYDTIERGLVARVGRRSAKQRGVLANLKQVQALLACGTFQLQHQLAAKADVFLVDGDGVPSEAAPLSLLDAGLGILELELRQVFLLLQMHEGVHATQLFNGAGRGGSEVEVGQGNTD